MSRQKVVGVVLLGVAALVAAVAGACTSVSLLPPGKGPLQFPTGYEIVLRPIDGKTFFVLEACLAEADGEVEVTAASADGGEVLVNLSGPTDIGAGSAAEMSNDFVSPAAGVAGQVASCGTPPGKMVEMAVVLPEAVHEDMQVDGFQVTYKVDGEVYQETVDARFTTCASAPKRPAESACS